MGAHFTDQAGTQTCRLTPCLCFGWNLSRATERKTLRRDSPSCRQLLWVRERPLLLGMFCFPFRISNPCSANRHIPSIAGETQNRQQLLSPFPFNPLEVNFRWRMDAFFSSPLGYSVSFSVAWSTVNGCYPLGYERDYLLVAAQPWTLGRCLCAFLVTFS